MRSVVLLVLGMAAAPAIAGQPERVPLPWDWSHTQKLYNPDMPEEAQAKGQYDEWLSDWQDPRFRGAVIKKHNARTAPEKDLATIPLSGPVAKAQGGNGRNPHDSSKDKIDGDWSNLIGSGTGTAADFPAKYNFDIAAAPDCVNDFLIVPMAVAGNPGSGTQASQTGSVAAGGAGAGTVTITNGTSVLTLTQSTTQNTGLFFMANSNPTNQAVNIAAAINRNGGVVGVASTASGATVTVTATRVGPQGNNIQVSKTGVAGFSWGAANLAGGSGTPSQGNLVGFNQLYKTTCDDKVNNPPTRRVPATMFYYNTSTGGVIDTSPVISLDGTQVAVTERNGSVSSLVLIKFSGTVNPGTPTNPTTPTLAVSAAAYRSCAAPCMYKFSLGADDTVSSPYYDYGADTMYLGDAAGKLHKFNGVFLGTPTEAGSPWPVTVSAGNQLSSPIYDELSQLVFVGSPRAVGSGGQLHSVNASGTVVSTAQIASNPGGAAATGVTTLVLNSFAKRVYAYVSNDNTTACSNAPCLAVIQFRTDVSLAGLSGTSQQIGQGGIATRFIRQGAFDNGYWLSTPTNPTGFLYVCGSSQPSQSARPTLYRIPITNNVMGTAVVGPKMVQNAVAECSPVTEVMNGANDYLFVSVPAAGNDAACSGSCIYMYNLTGITWGAATAASAGFPAEGGTSGIVIDNVSSVPGTSQVYYMTLTSPGSIVQVSQSQLR